MYKQLREIYSLLTKEQQRKLKKLQLLVVFMAFAEIAGVISIGPFMALVGDIDQLNSEGLIGMIYRESGFSHPEDFLFFVGISVLGMLTLATCISIVTVWRLSVYGQQVGADLSSRLFKHYMHKEWLFHANNSSSQLVNKVSQECLRITNEIITPLMRMNAKIVLATLMIICVFLYNPQVAITGLVIFIIAYTLLYRTVRKKLVHNGNNVTLAQQQRFKLLGEGLGGIKDVLLLARQEEFTNRFYKSSAKFAAARGANEALTMAPRYAMELVAFGSVIFLILYLLLTHDGNLGQILPMLSVYALAGFKLLPALQQIYISLSSIRGSLAAFENLRDDLYESSEATNEDIFPCVGKGNYETAQMSPKRLIKLKDIIFSYTESSKPAINKLNLEIPANQVIGLVGSSGSGKSTLIDILLGLVDPQSGNLIIDDVTISKNNVRKWQNTVGFVPQSIFLSDSTIKENIGFGLPLEVIDDNKVQRAIKLAHLDELISELPEGIMTKVGERGVQLSGGQRQRIGIARALYDDADVLILDEATSALDGITEKLIMDAIHDFSGNKTIIMIAHRLSTIKQCDKIFVMQKGKIANSGTFEYLLNNSDLFSKMNRTD